MFQGALQVRHNKALVVDTNKFKHWEDVKCDMNVSFPLVLRTSTWTVDVEDNPSEYKLRNILCTLK